MRTNNRLSFTALPAALFIGLGFVLVCQQSVGQQVGRANNGVGFRDLPTSTSSTVPSLSLDLPDAPQPQSESSDVDPIVGEHAGRSPRFAPAPRAPLYNKYIEPGQTAQPLTGFGRKMYFGLHQIASPYFALAVVSSASYEHVVDSSPNYGTDKGAFGQRIGAAAIRNISDSVFSDGLMPALLHQDSRYYVMGKRRRVLPRGVYAATRVFVGRSDKGVAGPNFALFAGHAATAALENAYYPADNRGASETVANFAGSLVGTVLSNTVREFLPDLLHLAHLE